MLSATIVTVLARKFSMQSPMILGAVVLGGGFASASFATRIWHLYLTQGVLVGLRVGFIYIPSVPVLSQWFLKRRSLANSIGAAGSGIGGLIFSFATGPMIRNICSGWSLRSIVIITFITNIAAAILIRDRNSEIRLSQLALDRKLLSRVVVGLLSMLGYVTLLFSSTDYATSIGLNQTQADQITAFLNLGTACGRPFIGVLSNRVGRIEVAGGATLLCSILVFAIWIPANSYRVVVLFALLGGAILGVYWVGCGPPPQSRSNLTVSQTIGPLCAELQSSGIWNHFFLFPGCQLYFQGCVSGFKMCSLLLTYPVSEVIALEMRRPNAQRVYLYPQLFCNLTYLCANLCPELLWRMKRRKVFRQR